MASVQRHARGREIVVLDDDTLSDHVTLPAHLLKKRHSMGPTAFSDVLRVNLLARHGGTWIDASVLLTGDIGEVTSNLPFFVFTRANDPYMLSSWFIHSTADHPLVCAMRDLLTRYWAVENQVRAYFMLHFLFEAAVTLHADLRDIWRKMPIVSADGPHLLQMSLDAGSNFERLKDVCRAIPVNKLSYKFPEPVMLQAERIAIWAKASHNCFCPKFVPAFTRN